MEKNVYGYKCKQCGCINYPYRMRCKNCRKGEYTDFEPVPLPKKGKLLTYTWLHNPPSDFMVVALGLGIVELENGVRVTCQLKVPEPVIGMNVTGKVEEVRAEGYNRYFGLVFYPA